MTKTQQYQRASALDVGDVVTIRRTSGVPQPHATVIDVARGREYMAPELQTFNVEFRCVETGKMATRWCSAFDLLPDESDDEGIDDGAVERYYEDRYDCQSGDW